MEKLQIDDLGVYKDDSGKFFTGLLSNDYKFVTDPLTEKLYTSYSVEFLGLLSEYYPKPLFLDTVKGNIFKIGSKKSKRLACDCLDSSLISKEELKAFDEKLTKYCKKEEKLMRSGNLLKTSGLSHKPDKNEAIDIRDLGF